MNERQKIKTATIIMPVYNGEAFLRRSVRSVFAQTWGESGGESGDVSPDSFETASYITAGTKKMSQEKRPLTPRGRIEFIAIDDGSVDGSWKLLRRLARKAPASVRVLIFRQENAGICATRNRALDLAEGDYVFFLDQDDCIKRDYVERLVSELEARRADMLIGGYTLVDENMRVLQRGGLDSRLPWHKYRYSAPWGRVFRRDIIEKNHVRFLQTRISEDFYFNLVYMSCCGQVAVTGYSGYAWTYRAASESHTGMRRLEEERNPLPMMSRVLQDMKEPNNVEPELLEYMMIKHIVWYLLYTAGGAAPEDLHRACRECFGWLEEHFPSYARNPMLAPGKPRGESMKVSAIVCTAVRLQQAGLFEPMLRVWSLL